MLIGVHDQKSLDALPYKAAKVVFQKYKKYHSLPLFKTSVTYFCKQNIYTPYHDPSGLHELGPVHSSVTFDSTPPPHPYASVTLDDPYLPCAKFFPTHDLCICCSPYLKCPPSPPFTWWTPFL